MTTGDALDVVKHPLRTVTRRMMRGWCRVARASGWCYQAIDRWGSHLATSPLDACLMNGSRMRCSLQDQVQRQIYFFGAYEPVEVHIFQQFLRSGMTVVDAGANVGQYTLVAAMGVGARGQVHAFEPVPSTYASLRDHVLLNGVEHIVRANSSALWHREEQLTFSLPAEMSGNAGAYRACPVDGWSAQASAHAVRLDDYAARADMTRLDVMKLDVEGAELRVLEGAWGLISRHRPTLLMEVDRSLARAFAYVPEDIWRLLAPLGYRAWHIGYSPDTSGELSGLDGIQRANVLFTTETFPPALTSWSLVSLRRSHRRDATRHERRAWAGSPA